MKSITKNTIYLYCLTASNYLFGIVTIPFITRVLGPDDYGILGFAIALSVYFNLFIDFGFLLSGTKKVTEEAGKKNELRKIFSSISYIKFIITLFLFVFVCILGLFVDEISNNFSLLILYLISSMIYSLLPDYLYRGMEDMKMVTIRSVIARGVSTVLLIVFFRERGQILMIPMFNIIGGAVSFGWVYMDLRKKYEVKFCRINTQYAIKLLRESCPFFMSRIASSIYNASNTLILGLIYPGQPVVGYYSSAEKFWSLTSQGCTPISDSYYPYMIRTKNYIRLFKVTFLCEIPIIICCIVAFIWAEPICCITFGKDFSEAHSILRLMLPIMIMILPTYMFGFPALTPMGLSKWANKSIFIAMINQLIGLTLLFLIGEINVTNICVLTIISQFMVLILRIYFVLKGFNNLKKTDCTI